MIYQKQFIKETTLTAIAIFFVVLAILVFTQGVNLLGRAVTGQVAVDAVLALIGFWTLGMTPLLLVLTAYISTLTVLTRYWRDSEMSIWLASGLGLKKWLKPVWTFAIPLAILVAVMQLAVLPWAELRSREYAEILKQKQNLSLIEEGIFREVNKGSPKGRVYFIEQLETEQNSDKQTGVMRNVFLRETNPDNNRDTVVFAKEGAFDVSKPEERTLILKNGYRYVGTAGKADFEQTAFQEARFAMANSTKLVNPIEHRRTIPSLDLIGSNNPVYQAELMWRISLPITILLLSLLAIPISYFNPRSGSSYHVFIAVGFFLLYQNGLTILRDAVERGKISFWVGFLPMHIIILISALVLMNIRNKPAKPFLSALKSLFVGSNSN